MPAPNSAPPLNSACRRNNRPGADPSAAVAATFIVTSTRPPPETVKRKVAQKTARLVVAARTTQQQTPHDERRRQHRARAVAFGDDPTGAVGHDSAEDGGREQQTELGVAELEKALHIERDDRPRSPEEPEREEGRPQRSHDALWPRGVARTQRTVPRS